MEIDKTPALEAFILRLSFLQGGNCGSECPGDEVEEDSSRATHRISDDVCHSKPCTSYSVVMGITPQSAAIPLYLYG